MVGCASCVIGQAVASFGVASFMVTDCDVNWSTAMLSYNVNGMSEREMINGAPVTEEQIAAWADEAEVGYDIAALKRRGRGRPGRGAEPSQVIALRLTADEISALDARAEREGKSRSEVIREALASA